MFFVAEMEMEIDIFLKYPRSRFFLFASWDSLSSYFAGEKVWRCSSFSSVSSLARFVVVECREKCSFFSASWTDFFFLHGCSIRILRFLLCSNWSRSYSNVDTFFFFTKAKDEIRNLSSSKSCRCLQAQWWKMKSLLDRWNLPSGYVSSMESNCWSSENFLSVD